MMRFRGSAFAVCLIVGCVQSHGGDGFFPEDANLLQPDTNLSSRQLGDVPTADTHGGFDIGALTQVIFISATVTENPRSALSAIVDIELNQPAAVAVAFESAETGEQITGYREALESQRVIVVGMRPNTAYTLTPIAVSGDGSEIRHTAQSFITGSLPAGILEMEVIIYQPEKVQPGITLLGPANSHKKEDDTPDYVGVDSAGQVVWYYHDDSVRSSGDGPPGGHLAREARQLPDGNLLLSFRTHHRVVTPGGETVRVISGGTGAAGCNMGLGNIHHDADLVPSGHALLLSVEHCPVDGTPMGDNIMVKGDTLFEVNPAGDVVWEWHALNFLDPTRFPGPLSRRQLQGAYDWSHANSVTFMPDDNSILMSFRHQNWIVKIDRETKLLKWILGDTEGEQIPFALSLEKGGAWFYSQHAPVMNAAGEILIYDNGNERPGEANSYSRAVIYALDEEVLSAVQVWEYLVETYTPFLGDANWLPNGNVLISAGGVRLGVDGPESGASKPGIAQVVEVTVDGAQGEAAKVWELKTEAFVYRANRIESFWPSSKGSD